MDKLPDELHAVMGEFWILTRESTDGILPFDTSVEYLNALIERGFISSKDGYPRYFVDITDKGEAYRRYHFPTKDEQIADLRAENERLRDALRPFAIAAAHNHVVSHDGSNVCLEHYYGYPLEIGLHITDLFNAASALKDES